jgi:hypothetical protein
MQFHGIQTPVEAFDFVAASEDQNVYNYDMRKINKCV